MQTATTSAQRTAHAMAPNPTTNRRLMPNLSLDPPICTRFGNEQPVWEIPCKAGPPDLQLHPASRKHMGDRAEEQLDVGPQRPVGDVEVIDLDHLVHRDARGAEDLPRPGHARGEVQARAEDALDLRVLV